MMTTTDRALAAPHRALLRHGTTTINSGGTYNQKHYNRKKHATRDCCYCC